MATACLESNKQEWCLSHIRKSISVWVALRIKQEHKELPERDEHHHFDTQEFAHWFDWTQFLSQSSVEQHQAVHGKLDPVQTEEVRKWTLTRIILQSHQQRTVFLITSCDILLKMTRYVHAFAELKLPSSYTPHSWQILREKERSLWVAFWNLTRGKLPACITQLTYRAITVVTGLTTVYCNTPSLHLQSKTLERKSESSTRGPKVSDKTSTYFQTTQWVTKHTFQ